MSARMDLEFWDSVRGLVRSGGTATWDRHGVYFSIDGSQDPPMVTVESDASGPLELTVYRMAAVATTNEDGSESTWLTIATNACQLRWEADEPEREPNMSSGIISRMIKREKLERMEAEAQEAAEEAEEGYE